jgi:hypothetical protein
MTKTEAYQNSLQFLGLTKKNGVGVGELYALKPTNNGGNFVWSRALSAYRTNQDGLLELVASGTPRVDYSNTCPELLIEKASTNIILQSNSLTASFSGTIGTDDTIAPDGLMTADSFNVTDNTSGGTYKNITLVSGNTYTYSVWLKGSINGQKVLVTNDFNGVLATFTLTTDWFRYSVTFVANSSSAQSLYLLNGLYVSPTNNDIYYVWGQQLEQSTYVTSYIPTTSATITRPQDIAYNTTIAYGLKGTIFIRARIFSSTYTKVDTLFSLNDETLDNYITCSTNSSRSIFITTMTNPDTNSYTYALASDGIYSIAIGYDFTGINNKLNIAINGVLKRANAAQVNNPPISLTRIDLGSLFGTLPSVDNRIIGQMYFADQLSDTDLTALTVQ